MRDKLVNGELDAAHVLWGLIYGVQMGLGGPKKDMAILMNLNHNGQAMTLSRKLYDKGVKDATSLAALIAKEKGEYTFAHTFPTGTHAMWLYYWLATYGVHPFNDVKTITVPPPQMVANMRVGNMDGYCVGEPWPYRAIVDKIGFTAETTQAYLEGSSGEGARHDRRVRAEKSEHGARHHSGDHRCRPLDRCLPCNRQKTAEVVSDKSYVNTDKEVIVARMLGRYDNGIGKSWDDKDHMKFYNDGHTPFPYLSDGMWFLTQHRRWGTAEAGCRLPGDCAPGQSARHLQAGRRRGQGKHAEGADAYQQIHRRCRMGWQEPDAVRIEFQDQVGRVADSCMHTGTLARRRDIHCIVTGGRPISHRSQRRRWRSRPSGASGASHLTNKPKRTGDGRFVRG